MTGKENGAPAASTWSRLGKSHDKITRCGTKTFIGIAGNLQERRSRIRCVTKAEERIL